MAEPGAAAAKELYTELECEVFHELEQFVSDPQFIEALERPVKAGKESCLKAWSRWATGHRPRSDTVPELAAAEDAEPLVVGEDELPTGGDAVLDSASSSGQDGWQIVDKQHAVEAMAMYIAACIMDMPESQTLTPRQLQVALQEALRTMKRSRFQKVCSFGRRVYRWGSYSYSAVQLYQCAANPWVIRAVLAALWASSRVGLRFLI